jgi:hypothetical protein
VPSVFSLPGGELFPSPALYLSSKGCATMSLEPLNPTMSPASKAELRLRPKGPKNRFLVA